MRGDDDHAPAAAKGGELTAEERARQRLERLQHTSGLRQTLADYRQRHHSMGDEALVRDMQRARLGDRAGPET